MTTIVPTSEEDPMLFFVRFASELAWADAGPEVAEPHVTRLCMEAQESIVMGKWLDLASLMLTSADVVFSKVSDKDLECIFSVICNLVTKLENPEEVFEGEFDEFQVFTSYYFSEAYIAQKWLNPWDIHLQVFSSSTRRKTMTGLKELVQLLISKGADVNAVAVGLGTPLQYAAGRGKGDHVELLLKHRANPNVISHDLFSPLLASIRGKSLECMDLLIKAGADLNFCGSNGMTPLGYAASEGLKEFVRCLLTAGADPNFVNDLGMNPVENAALSYKRGLVRILFPLTSPIPAIPEWSISGLFKQVHFDHAKVEREHKLKEQFIVSNSKGNECFYQKDYFGAMQWYTQVQGKGRPLNKKQRE